MFKDRSSDCRCSVRAVGYLLRCFESCSDTVSFIMSTPSLVLTSYLFDLSKRVLAVCGRSACPCLLRMVRRASMALCFTWKHTGPFWKFFLKHGCRIFFAFRTCQGCVQTPSWCPPPQWAGLKLKPSLPAVLPTSNKVLVSLVAAIFRALDTFAQTLSYCLLRSLDVIQLLYWCLCQKVKHLFFNKWQFHPFL